jgi:hypothetical protein
LQHQADGRAVARRHELYRGFGQASGLKPFGQGRKNGPAGAHAVGTTAQDRGVTGFQAEHGGIGCNVRPTLVDDTDHPERYAHALDSHPVRLDPGFRNDANRIVEFTHHLDTCRDGFNAPGVERKPVEKGTGDPGGLCFGHILGVGRKYRRSLRTHGGGHPCERAVLLLSRGKRQDPARATGAQPDFPHDAGNVGGSLDTLERRGHGRKP